LIACYDAGDLVLRPPAGLSTRRPELPIGIRVVSLEPVQRAGSVSELRLEPFDPAQAERVAGWVRNEREAYWFAPKTTPPIAARDIRGWGVAGHEQLQLLPAGAKEPVAYGELNALHGAHGQYWLGHLIVDPGLRGQGIGQVLTRLLLNRAFRQLRARRVSLVVFPDNATAIACYRAAGMREDGFEEHDLPAYGARARLLRMAAP
jgi:RimJ/RimL family protein N-acetyltransferase